MPPVSLGDTLLLADELAPVESPLRDLDGVPRVGAAASIELMVGQATLSEILAESSEHVLSPASLIVPFRPSSKRSLKCAGSYTPSSSRISVSAKAQISRRRCQSVELRARRDTSRPMTIPARPSPTSLTSRWKPSRSTALAPDWPRSESMTTT